jgi:hypothetical protein
MEFRRKIDQMLACFKSHPSSLVRASVGVSLVVAGVLGPFLPVLGIWMVPMGLVLLSVDFPAARRLSAYLLDRWRSVKALWRGKK